jgi:DNA-binding transcriptional ArsR family regulator
MITILLNSNIVKTGIPMKDRPNHHRALAPAQLEAIADLFGALSEPSRLRVLQALQASSASVGELAGQTGLKQANLSKQLGILLAAGIIARRQEGNRAIYSIAMPIVHDLCGLVCDGVARQAAQRAAALRVPRQ